MSTLQNQSDWTNISNDRVSKHEKCRNITEEIYKRINITFEIKKLETTNQSDVSDHSDTIDSNELSNGTDLFACDKTDSIPSSSGEKPPATCEKYININNNEETQKKSPIVYKRPRKRFRKRVKKRRARPASESDDSDEALPLSRMLDTAEGTGELAIPKILILTKDLKSKIILPEKKQIKKTDATKPVKAIDNLALIKDNVDSIIDAAANAVETGERSLNKVTTATDKNCSKCSLKFRGHRGLRRHMAMTHLTTGDTQKATEPKDSA